MFSEFQNKDVIGLIIVTKRKMKVRNGTNISETCSKGK